MLLSTVLPSTGGFVLPALGGEDGRAFANRCVLCLRLATGAPFRVSKLEYRGKSIVHVT